jgi:hypothetical protein
MSCLVGRGSVGAVVSPGEDATPNGRQLIITTALLDSPVRELMAQVRCNLNATKLAAMYERIEGKLREGMLISAQNFVAPLSNCH